VLFADVGPVRPANFAQNRRRPRPETSAATTRGAAAGNPTPAEAERALVRIERNFTELTRTVPMIDIEDMPPSLQTHMVGLPRSWVRLFRRLGRVVHDYNRAHSPEPTRRLFMCLEHSCIIFFEGISPSDSLWLPLFEALAPIYVL
jgi:hypothetical protein